MPRLGRQPTSELGTGRARSLWLSPEANLKIDEAMGKDSRLTSGRAASLLLESSDPRWPERALRLEKENKALRDNLKQREGEVAELRSLATRFESSLKADRSSIKAIEKLDLTGIHPRLRQRVSNATR